MIIRYIFRIILISVTVYNSHVRAQDMLDITDSGGIATAQYEDVTGFGVNKAIDNNITTRYLTYNSSAFIQYQSLGNYIVNKYSITSANNSPDRDPLNWIFYASNDNTNWVALDNRTNEDFTTRFERREFDFENSTGYMYYRLDMTNNSGTILHLAEWEIFGTAVDDGALTPPLSPGNLSATPSASDQIELSWSDNSTDENVFRIDCSENQTEWTPIAVVDKNTTSYLCTNLNQTTKYYFRLLAANSKGLSDFSNIDSAVTLPPETWQEHWFEHNQVVSRVYYDDDLVVYYDKDMNKNINWPFQYLGDVWRYTKNVYGDFGKDPRLYAIFHANKYSGGHPFYYYDADHDYRNGIDCGAFGMNAWTDGTGNDLDLTTHEICHIVESATFGTQGSPAFGSAIWGDSKWAEIFIYDVYIGLGRVNDAQRWYNLVINQSNSQPKTGTYWFKNWFYPVWKDYGQSAVLLNYFRLISEYFPRNGAAFSRSINWGEFVHFFSGAAGVSLKNQAEKAFGWSYTFEAQFQKAKIDFPGITYQVTSVDKNPQSLPETYFLHQNYPNPFNPETTISFNTPKDGNANISVYNIIGQKIITLTNKFLKAGAHSTFWNGNNESGKQCPSGIYFYRLECNDFTASKSMILLR